MLGSVASLPSRWLPHSSSQFVASRFKCSWRIFRPLPNQTRNRKKRECDSRSQESLARGNIVPWGRRGGMDLQPISRYRFSPFSFSRFSLLPLSCRCRSPYITPPQFLLPYPPLLLPNPRSLSSSSHLLLSSALRRYKEGREASPPPPALLIPPPLSLSLSLRNWRNYI